MRALENQAALHTSAVAKRAPQFPVVADVLGDPLDAVLSGRRVVRGRAPRLLALLEGKGRNTFDLLAAIESVVDFFDTRPPHRWREVRRSLGRARRDKFLSLCSELIIARWVAAVGFEVLEMEPENGAGGRADLQVGYGAETLCVEITTPQRPDSDWTDNANERLAEGLRRIGSGLEVEVSGYEPLIFRPDEHEWGREATRADSRAIDDVVRAFACGVASLDRSSLPAVVVGASPDQPVSIVAVREVARVSDRTDVQTSWSRSGLVPDVDRLVGRVTRERKQLPVHEPGAVLVDLSRWRDFEPGDYYWDQGASRLAEHHLPTFVATFDWTSKAFLPEARGVMHASPEWKRTALGRRLAAAWAM